MNAIVDVGVIYTHERNFIIPLLKSLKMACENINARLILVDNNSGADMNEFIELVKPMPVKVLTNASRLNYSKNLNVILKNSEAKYVLLMNTDMEFIDGDPCVRNMVVFMEANLDCGLSCCRLIGKDGQFMWPARRYQTIGTILSRRLHFLFRRDAVENNYLYKQKDQKDSFECDWFSGCFIMTRRKAFEQIGFIDEKFLKYFEDVDYCVRMWLSDWKVMYNGKTSCIHLEQRASKNIFSKDAFYHLKSYFYFLTKWGLRKLKGAKN